MDTVYRVSVLMKIITTWSINCSWDCNIQAQTRMKEKGSEEEHEEGSGEEHEEGSGEDQKGERSGEEQEEGQGIMHYPVNWRFPCS